MTVNEVCATSRRAVEESEDEPTEYAVTFAVTFHLVLAIHCLCLLSIPVPAIHAAIERSAIVFFHLAV